MVDEWIEIVDFGSEATHDSFNFGGGDEPDLEAERVPVDREGDVVAVAAEAVKTADDGQPVGDGI